MSVYDLLIEALRNLREQISCMLPCFVHDCNLASGSPQERLMELTIFVKMKNMRPSKKNTGPFTIGKPQGFDAAETANTLLTEY